MFFCRMRATGAAAWPIRMAGSFVRKTSCNVTEVSSWLKICKPGGMNGTQLIGLAAGILTACSLLPQVIKNWKEKKAEDVSLVMLFVLQAGLVLWIVYGFKRSDLPIIVTNCFSLLVNIVMVLLGIKYKKRVQ